MFNLFERLSEIQKGTLLIVSGLILLFHTLGIIETGLNYIIIFGSLFMIVYGLVLVNVHKKIMALIKKEQIKHDE